MVLSLSKYVWHWNKSLLISTRSLPKFTKILIPILTMKNLKYLLIGKIFCSIYLLTIFSISFLTLSEYIRYWDHLLPGQWPAHTPSLWLLLSLLCLSDLHWTEGLVHLPQGGQLILFGWARVGGRCTLPAPSEIATRNKEKEKEDKSCT